MKRCSCVRIGPSPTITQSRLQPRSRRRRQAPRRYRNPFRGYQAAARDDRDMAWWSGAASAIRCKAVGSGTPSVVAGAHAVTATTTEQQPLKQPRALPGRALSGRGGVLDVVVVELLLVGHELVPANVRRVLGVEAGAPGFLRDPANLLAQLAVDEARAVLASTEGIGPGVDGVVEHGEDERLSRRDPAQRPGHDRAGGQLEPVVSEVAADSIGAAVQTEALEN
jgi:hypothetical protein